MAASTTVFWIVFGILFIFITGLLIFRIIKNKKR